MAYPEAKPPSRPSKHVRVQVQVQVQGDRPSSPPEGNAFVLPAEAGSAEDSKPQRELWFPGPVFAGTTTPPQPRHSSAAGLNRPEEPALRSLPELRDRKRRLSVLLEEIDMRPDGLDVMARDVHETLVMPAYELMHTEAAKALGSQWGKRDQDRFGDTYHAAASKWPAYREALRQSRGHGTSTDDAMVRLEGPRSAYIAALSGFYDAFSSTLDIFFPSLPDRCRGSYILWSSSLDDPR